MTKTRNQIERMTVAPQPLPVWSVPPPKPRFIIAADEIMRDPRMLLPPAPAYPVGVPHNVYRMMMGHLLAANQARDIIREYESYTPTPQPAEQPPPKTD